MDWEKIDSTLRQAYRKNGKEFNVHQGAMLTLRSELPANACETKSALFNAAISALCAKDSLDDAPGNALQAIAGAQERLRYARRRILKTIGVARCSKG